MENYKFKKDLKGSNFSLYEIRKKKIIQTDTLFYCGSYRNAP